MHLSMWFPGRKVFLDKWIARVMSLMFIIRLCFELCTIAMLMSDEGAPNVGFISLWRRGNLNFSRCIFLGSGLCVSGLRHEYDGCCILCIKDVVKGVSTLHWRQEAVPLPLGFVCLNGSSLTFRRYTFFRNEELSWMLVRDVPWCARACRDLCFLEPRAGAYSGGWIPGSFRCCSP